MKKGRGTDVPRPFRQFRKMENYAAPTAFDDFSKRLRSFGSR